jgi:hypothetical protein
MVTLLKLCLLPAATPKYRKAWIAQASKMIKNPRMPSRHKERLRALIRQVDKMLGRKMYPAGGRSNNGRRPPPSRRVPNMPFGTWYYVRAS